MIADDIIVKIGCKGAEGINNASIARSDKTIVTAGTVVHKSCRMTYVNKKHIEKHKKARLDIPTLSVKRIGVSLLEHTTIKQTAFSVGTKLLCPRRVQIMRHIAVLELLTLWKK